MADPSTLMLAAQRHLKAAYGYDDFRPLQKRVVESVLAGRDTLAVLPTGGGKSICFQIPALALGGLTIVISPLLALMADQVAALKRRGVKAESLNSLLSAEDSAAVMQRLGAGEIRLLYLSPERAERLAPILGELGIRPSLLAIDEAHCISEWGHDFRPSYRRLAAFREAIGAPQTVALTGSATAQVRDDIAASLVIRGHRLILGSFNRTNLWFGVERIHRPSDRLPALLRHLAPRPGIAIVYASTRNSADTIAQRLRFAGHKAVAYHAGLTRERRGDLLNQFIAEELEVVVATSAFGMGIDAPRVKLVVHWSMSPTPESYYQEAGRAGRDGNAARCLLLYHPQDSEIHRRQLDVTFPSRKLLEELWRDPVLRRRHPSNVLASADRLAEELGAAPTSADWLRVRRRRQAAERRLEVMNRYALDHRCRRQALLGYFGEESKACGDCDVCQGGGRLHRVFRKLRSFG
jgi:ATP-dependent DNA helicase RecQ